LKLLEKDLKDLENEADKIVKDTSKENDNVTKEEEGIRQSEAEIQRLKEAQSMKKSEISEATEVLNDFASEQAKFK
jgi:peptidoglycan hydrolase CwlO-like protein